LGRDTGRDTGCDTGCDTGWDTRAGASAGPTINGPTVSGPTSSGPTSREPTRLFQLQLPRCLGSTHPRLVALVDVGLAYPQPHRLRPVTELIGDPLDRAVVMPQLGTHGPNHPRRRGLLLLRVPPRGRLPGDCSFGMTPSPFPRSGASTGPSGAHPRVGPVGGFAVRGRHRPVVAGVGRHPLGCRPTHMLPVGSPNQGANWRCSPGTGIPGR